MMSFAYGYYFFFRRSGVKATRALEELAVEPIPVDSTPNKI
jgi:hypothetical protein